MIVWWNGWNGNGNTIANAGPVTELVNWVTALLKGLHIYIFMYEYRNETMCAVYGRVFEPMEHSFACTWCMCAIHTRVSVHCTRFLFLGCFVYFFSLKFVSLSLHCSTQCLVRIGWVLALWLFGCDKHMKTKHDKNHGIFTSAFGAQCHSVLSSFVAFFRLDLRFLVPFFFSGSLFVFACIFSSLDFYFVLLYLSFILLFGFFLVLFLCFALRLYGCREWWWRQMLFSFCSSFFLILFWCRVHCSMCS